MSIKCSIPELSGSVKEKMHHVFKPARQLYYKISTKAKLFPANFIAIRNFSTTTMDIGGNIRKAAYKIQEADALVITAGAGMGVDSGNIYHSKGTLCERWITGIRRDQLVEVFFAIPTVTPSKVHREYLTTIMSGAFEAGKFLEKRRKIQGLPDFRGPEGFWRAYPPIQRLGLKFPEVSTPHWFHTDPTFAWGFFGHRYHLYKKTTPHKGFTILLDWAKAKQEGYFVFTSNVDGHFQKAGFSEDNLIECHGSLNWLQQVRPRGNDIWQFPSESEVAVDENTMRAQEPLPQGPPDVPTSNQGLARPNVLMFGDWEWISDRTDSQENRFSEFARRLESRRISFVVIEIGAGLAVPTVRMTGERLVARNEKGTLVRINPREPEVPGKRHVSLPLKGLEALERIKSLFDGSERSD